MLLKEIIIILNNLKEEDITSDNLKKLKRNYSKKNKLSRIPTNIQIL
jgi:histone acetyltransferase (RNA polymerase elongator complex component)